MNSAAFTSQLKRLHRDVQAEHPALLRIAFAIFDPATGLVKTYSHSTINSNPLVFYDCPLDEAPSLAMVAESRQPRIINDTRPMAASSRWHARMVALSGLKSSYTKPIFSRDVLQGFLFLNADTLGYFDASRMRALTLLVRHLELLFIQALVPHHTFRGAVRMARKFSGTRDEETPHHLERMARYARLIVRELQAEEDIDDAFAEALFQFAPLHDVGKIAVADSILFKPGTLSEAELAEMRSHAQKGAAIIDDIVEAFDLDAGWAAEIMRNIVLYHHESPDGSGYPFGKRGAAIPLEARVTKVADVFDALTSSRPYKQPWPLERAFSHLQESIGKQFDGDCVKALIRRRSDIEAIRRNFPDESFEVIETA